MKTAKLFGGDLYIASGSCYQEIVPGRPKKSYALDVSWRGVAIGCRFRMSHILEMDHHKAQDDPGIQKLMKLLIEEKP